MDYPHDIEVKDYFKIHDYYSKKYGINKTITLIQVGSFHECYCTDKKGLNLEMIAQDLDVVCTCKNSKKEISESNWRMLGFPIHTIDNFVEKLCELNFTVVIIDQIYIEHLASMGFDTSSYSKLKVSRSKNGEEFIRKVTRIESPATFLNGLRICCQLIASS